MATGLHEDRPVCESLSLLYECPSIAPHFPLGHSPYNICPSQVPAPHALRASPMKARSLTPAERVGGRPPSMHTLLPLCLTAGPRRPITPQLGFFPPSEENFPLRMTNSPTNNSKLGFSGSFRGFLTCLNIKGTASYGQQPSRPHYTACSLCSHFQDIQTKHQSTENSTTRSKEKSLK